MSKILRTAIVDDDPIVVFGMKLMLKQLGLNLETHVWNNGQEALEGLMDLVPGRHPGLLASSVLRQFLDHTLQRPTSSGGLLQGDDRVTVQVFRGIEVL